MNTLGELGENLVTVDREDRVDEEMLERCLKAIKGPQVEEELGRMFDVPEIDIRCYAERALDGLWGLQHSTDRVTSFIN